MYFRYFYYKASCHLHLMIKQTVCLVFYKKISIKNGSIVKPMDGSLTGEIGKVVIDSCNFSEVILILISIYLIMYNL